MEFKAGQKVKILSSRSDNIEDIRDMIGGVFVIQNVSSFNCLINGWFFDPDEIEAFEEVQETKPSMFQMQGFNQEAAFLFHDYVMKERQTRGLCFMVDQSKIAGLYDFLKNQKPFEKSRSYPVEYAIQKKNKKSTSSAHLHNMYSKGFDTSRNLLERNRESCRLRIWWAYNLAVKLSQDPDALSELN